MKRIYGYCRISTKHQNIERQVRNILKAYPDADIRKEAYTGTKVEGRRAFERILKEVRSGDTIVFDSVSRMSRNASEGVTLYERLYNDGIELVFLKEPHVNTSVYREALRKQQANYIKVDTGDTSTDTFINSILEALQTFQMDLAKKQIEIAFQQSEKEVTDLRQRTKEGIETARRNGKQIGQEKGRTLHIKKKAQAKRVIKRHNKSFGGTLTNEQTWTLAGISKMTFYKYRDEIIQEMQKEQG